jgi:Ca2+-binding EF-hand superfamily protein
MGCGGSKKVDALDFVRERYPRTLAFLELSPYSRQLAELFARNDRNGDQRLAISEFLKALQINKSRAAVRLFSICDMDGSGALDFRELMFTIWHICTVDDRGLSDVVFDIYDEDTNGLIDPDDLYRLLVDCYGKAHMDKPEIERILRHAETSGALTRLQFAAFAKRSPQTMKQMIDTQQRVREGTLGHKTWTILEKKRKSKTDPTFRPVRYLRGRRIASSPSSSPHHLASSPHHPLARTPLPSLPTPTPNRRRTGRTSSRASS